MKIEPFAEGDIPGLAGLQPPGWGDLALPFTWYLAQPFCAPVKATESGEIAGIGAGIRFPGTGWIGHIIVAPGHRRRGIGTAIVEHLLADLLAAGCTTISLVATPDGYPMYTRLGFATQSTYALMERRTPKRASGAGSAPSARARHAAPTGDTGPAESLGISVVPAEISDAEAIIAIDRTVSGEDRRGLHERLFRGGTEMYLVARVESVVMGFHCTDLGDGPIYAVAPSAGAALLDFRLPRLNRIGMPDDNELGVQTALQSGFVRLRGATRMVYGRPFDWRPECVYGRIGGNLG